MSVETSQSATQPSTGVRAIDAATDTAHDHRTFSGDCGPQLIGEPSHHGFAPAGGTLSTISAITREAPLASLFVAFLLGISIARRR